MHSLRESLVYNPGRDNKQVVKKFRLFESAAGNNYRIDGEWGQKKGMGVKKTIDIKGKCFQERRN